MPGRTLARGGKGVLFVAAMLLADGCGAADWSGLNGDIGLALVATRSVAPEGSSPARFAPYLYADAGRFFAREDTFGVKLVPIGWGALELVARYSTEATDDDGHRFPHRANPRPLGIGTFQETPVGGFFADAFVDPVSRGRLLEASYAAQLSWGAVDVYPQVGLARRDARYANHLYGVSAEEARQAATTPYQAGASVTPVLGLSGEWALSGRWVVTGNLRYERFDRAVTASPRVDRAAGGSVLIALARHFG